MAFVNDLRACESAEVASRGNAGAGLSTKWKVAKSRGGAQEEQLMWLCELKVCSGKVLCNSNEVFIPSQWSKHYAGRENYYYWYKQIILSLDFLPLACYSSLCHTAMYFHFISLVVMQHRTNLINGLQRCERLWNFETLEEFWLVGLASGTRAAFLAAI